MVDSTKFKFEKEDKIRLFFETLNYWGIQRKRTMIKCDNCGCLVAYIYDDGPPAVEATGRFHFQDSPDTSLRPRFKTKAPRVSTET